VRRAACGGIHERGGADECVGEHGVAACGGAGRTRARRQSAPGRAAMSGQQSEGPLRTFFFSSSVLLSFFVLYTYNNQQDGTAISNQQGVYGIMSI